MHDHGAAARLACGGVEHLRPATGHRRHSGCGRRWAGRAAGRERNRFQRDQVVRRGLFAVAGHPAMARPGAWAGRCRRQRKKHHAPHARPARAARLSHQRQQPQGAGVHAGGAAAVHKPRRAATAAIPAVRAVVVHHRHRGDERLHPAGRAGAARPAIKAASTLAAAQFWHPVHRRRAAALGVSPFKLIKESCHAMGSGHRAGNPRSALHPVQDVFRRVHRVRRRAQHSGLRRRSSAARRVAGGQPRCGGTRHPPRSGSGRHHRAALRLRAQELLLP